MVELMVAVVAASILVLTIGCVLVCMVRETVRSTSMTELQADMRVAVPAVYRLIREASGGSITAPVVGQTGTVFAVGSRSIFRANDALVAAASGSSLVYDPNTTRSGDELALSKGWVKNFSCVRGTNSLSFSLELNNGDTAMRVDGAGYYRN
jgi:hypothetical protein